MIVLNTLNVKFVEEASAQMGVDEWQGTNTTPASSKNILNQTTEDLIYGQTETIKFNGTNINVDSYVYKPQYDKLWDGKYVYRANWTKVDGKLPASDAEPSKSVVLDRAGLWLVIADDDPVFSQGDSFNMSNMSIYDVSDGAWEDIVGWFWVNSSTWTVTLDYNTAIYDNNDSVIVTVPEAAASTGWIDMWLLDGTSRSLIYHHELVLADAGIWTIANLYTYTHDYGAGIYQFTAYEDIDPYHDMNVYGENGDSGVNAGYNETFGNGSIAQWAMFDGSIRDCDGNTATGWAKATYKYATCGPFDPPEYLADGVNLTVGAGAPSTSIATANLTQYWNFSGGLNITLKDYGGNNITTPYNVYVLNDDDENVTGNFTVGGTGLIQTFSGYFLINSSNWGKNASSGSIFGENGTWSARIVKTNVGNTSEEWNGTAEWTVTGAPGLQFKWINDDGNLTSGTDNDGFILSVPTLAQQPLNISFQLISATHTYYGAAATAGQAPSEKGANITLSGDALFTGTLDKIPGVQFVGNTWYINLIPLMNTNGGEITISANWKNEGTATGTLTIGGDDLNGSIVTISPTAFVVDQNVTITVTVTGPTGYPYPNAYVALYWVSDSGVIYGLINATNGKGTTSGEYTFFFNATQQTTNQTLAGNPWFGGAIKAPRNISAYVNTPTVGYGYALATMKPQSDLKVTAEASASASTTTLMAGKRYNKIWFNTTVVDSIGNFTGYPADAGLKVRIYNETGADVTGDTSISSLATTDTDGKANQTATNEYFLKPGTYTVYAYNNTHNSEGNNATLVVKAVDVTCTKEEFIWKFDKNTSAIFMVKYNGELINGTLKLYNITDVGDYNRTWVNESGSGNGTISLTIINGVATLSNITAGYLPGSKAQENITFMFKLDASGAQYAKPNGFIPVKIPDVAPTPAIIPYNEEAKLSIRVTGRGTDLGDVFISIAVPGLDETNTTTDAQGIATFAFIPRQTGDIAIKIENRTSTTSVKITSWSLYISVPTSADEADTFVVTVRNESINGDVIEGATITFNGETYTTASDGTATINSLASIKVDTDERVTATLEGYTPASDTIKIINKPNLEITIDQTADGGKYVSPVDVYVSDDDGNLITAATVTFGDQVLTTINGKVTITVTTETTGTIGATKTGFSPAEDVSATIKPAGIPGFELLTLIAAIGVAFILLRRRRH